MYLWISPHQVAIIDQLALHFALDSNLLHCDSDEAQRQLTAEQGEGTMQCTSAIQLSRIVKCCPLRVTADFNRGNRILEYV